MLAGGVLAELLRNCSSRRIPELERLLDVLECLMVSVSASLWPACPDARTETVMMQDMVAPMPRTLSGRTCLKALLRTQSSAPTSRQPLVSFLLFSRNICRPSPHSCRHHMHCFEIKWHCLHQMCMLHHAQMTSYMLITVARFASLLR